METLISFFNINTTLFTLLGYKVSIIEFIGTLFGIASVGLAMRANIHTWSTGIANAILFFVLYFQVQLYSDMFLQIFFLASCIYGWWKWNSLGGNTSNRKISLLPNVWRLSLIITIVVATTAWGYLMGRVHLLLPDVFSKAAAFPYADAFTTVLSIFAMVLMAYKKIESWVLWVVIDLVSVYLYFEKGIVFISFEYVLFLGMATAGLISWIKFWKNAKRASSGQIHAAS